MIKSAPRICLHLIPNSEHKNERGQTVDQFGIHVTCGNRIARECKIHGTISFGSDCNARCDDDTRTINPITGRFDETTLFPQLPGKRFNTSIIQWQDGYALAFRNGWRGSEIFVARLDAKMRPIDCASLALNHVDADYGREDPRLFIFQGQLHCAFIGVVGGRRIRHTNQLYARLGDGFRVEQVFAPKLDGRKFWEKNWQFFEHAGELKAVYTINPHRVLTLDGEKITGDTSTLGLAWKYGDPRGGAPPVRVGDEYWHFFHSRIERADRLRVYCTGLYAFEAAPPFRITRHIPEPIQWADPTTKPADQYAAVVFCCGSVRDGDKWTLSAGIHDRWGELATFDHGALESRLVNPQPQ